MDDNTGQDLPQIDIMQLLHKDKMSVLEKCFEKRSKGKTPQKGLKITEFVKVMLQHLDYKKNDSDQKMKVTLALIDLFKQIDVNGDQQMQWQQFSNHIIQLGLLRNDRSFKNVIKSYYPSQTIIDKQKHQNDIQKVYFFQQLKMLLVIQQESSRFKVFNANNAALINQVIAHKGCVLAAQYIPSQDLIATSSNDLTINFWESSNFSIKQIVSVPQIQLCLKYADWKSANQQLIYTGGTDAIIHIYDSKTLKQKGTMSGWNPFYKKDQQQTGHSGPIGDILPIDSQQTIVTASLDGNICLWDSVTHSFKKQLRGHQKGIYSLDWSDWSPMNQCLLSAGLDHQAYVWNTYVSQKIFLLRGHNNPLVGVKCLPQSPQIITADMSGMVKVWDVRNFLCMQTFNVPTETIKSFVLTYSTNPSQPMKKRIICSSRKLHFFQYDQPKDQFLTDQKICLKIIFNDTLLVIISIHPDCIKVWDAKTGKLQSVYRQLSKSQLTAAILDYRQRKLFVGNAAGQIFTVNIKNGAKMRQFKKHSDIILNLCHWTGSTLTGIQGRSQDQRRLITISRGKRQPVAIHDEDAPQGAQNSIRYKMNQHQSTVNSIAIKQGTQLLASCSDDGTIVITNLLTFRQFVLTRKSSACFKKLMFLNPFDCLLACDNQGYLYFYGVGDSKFKNKQIFKLCYETISLTNKPQKFPVTGLNFFASKYLLIIGDQLGNIQIWSTKVFLQKLQQFRIINPKNKLKSSQQSSFLTQYVIQEDINPEKIFLKQYIQKIVEIKKAHQDGITHIQIIPNVQGFATSSFDCCCYIWNFQGRKIGSLLLGPQKNWEIFFNLQERKLMCINEAIQLQEQISKPDPDEIELIQQQAQRQNTTQNQTRMQKKKQDNLIKRAKDLIRKSDKTQKKQPNFILERAILLDFTEKQFRDLFEDDDQQDGNNYNLLKDVLQYKKISLEGISNIVVKHENKSKKYKKRHGKILS